MAKPEWGTKRMCQSCGTRYYDLRRDPPVCPKCETVFAPRSSTRHRRGTAALALEAGNGTAQAKIDKVKKVAVADKEHIEGFEDEVIDDDEEEVDVLDADEEDDGLMEDASELGEDDDDVSEVMEHLDDGDLSDRG